MDVIIAARLSQKTDGREGIGLDTRTRGPPSGQNGKGTTSSRLRPTRNPAPDGAAANPNAPGLTRGMAHVRRQGEGRRLTRSPSG